MFVFVLWAGGGEMKLVVRSRRGGRFDGPYMQRSIQMYAL